ncbi:hypothetical protein SCLCIDRAFT_1207808 [Scleroderma citrinum Foug A]|uniref:Uncharacterized protein n=1 Tax=Scleroderma citrinum Foug A TaxID=1036808 RepID=A0A0C3E9H4_9AGAM|nr:hypothetical protein SCLCIDRAFT_1207808 [Scleroderma citrinum Foug A]
MPLHKLGGRRYENGPIDYYCQVLFSVPRLASVLDTTKTKTYFEFPYWSPSA